MIDLALVLFGMSAFFCSLGVGGIGAAAVLDAWYRTRTAAGSSTLDYDTGAIPVLVMDDVDTVPIVVDPRRSA